MSPIKSSDGWIPNLNQNQKIALFLLRLALGWIFLYAGLTQIFDPSWSAAGYLTHAETASGFFNWLANPTLLPAINLINKWSLFLLGSSLILGLFLRLSSLLGMALVFLYYLPILNFPYVGSHFYLVDEHIIYLFVLLFFFTLRAGRIWGLDGWLTRQSLGRLQKLQGWLG